MYALAIAFTKLSIMVLYLRIFPDNTLRKIIYATSAFTIAFCIASVFATIFQCSPIRAAWDFDIKGSKCYDYTNFLYASAGINVATDVLICTMPLRHFWRLKLPKKQKLILCVLFVVGGL
jgi:hypothetical protein